jgi:hypothetical protein
MKPKANRGKYVPGEGTLPMTTAIPATSKTDISKRATGQYAGIQSVSVAMKRASIIEDISKAFLVARNFL